MTPRYWTQRFRTFIDKLEARLDTIHDEVMEAHAEIGRVSPLEHAPVAALDSAIQARFHRLGDKLDTAFDTYEEELDALDDASQADLDASRKEVEALRDAAALRIEKLEHHNKVLGAAVVARSVEALFREEDPSQHCVQCNTPFDPGPLAETRSMPCPSCGSRLTVAPKPAAAVWFGRGLQSMAQADALAAWDAARDAEHRYQQLGDSRQLDAYVAATGSYHQQVFDRLVADHPSWTPAAAAEQVEGRCQQIRTMHQRFGA